MVLSIEKKREGGLKSGTTAVKNKTGIHALSHKQTKANSSKGINILLSKLTNPEYRKLQGQKIRYGKWKTRFDKLKYENLDSQTYFIED